MSNSISNLVEIQKEIKKKKDNVRIIAVSKTFPITKIIPIINHGHIDYGENKVQEAVEKWTNLKNDFNSLWKWSPMKNGTICTGCTRPINVLG